MRSSLAHKLTDEISMDFILEYFGDLSYSPSTIVDFLLHVSRLVKHFCQQRLQYPVICKTWQFQILLRTNLYHEGIFIAHACLHEHIALIQLHILMPVLQRKQMWVAVQTQCVVIHALLQTAVMSTPRLALSLQDTLFTESQNLQNEEEEEEEETSGKRGVQLIICECVGSNRQIIIDFRNGKCRVDGERRTGGRGLWNELVIDRPIDLLNSLPT